jgi:dTDP-4-amino-4,6-dideoxygalactose transaminase
LHRRGIRVSLHYPPIHLQPYYRSLGDEAGAFPEAERYGREAMSLPLFPDLSAPDQSRVAAEVAAALEVLCQ